jgi:hypothetical protein
MASDKPSLLDRQASIVVAVGRFNVSGSLMAMKFTALSMEWAVFNCVVAAIQKFQWLGSHCSAAASSRTKNQALSTMQSALRDQSLGAWQVHVLCYLNVKLLF